MRILLASSEVHPYSKTGASPIWRARWRNHWPGAGIRSHRDSAVSRNSRALPEIHPFDWRLDLPLGPRFVHGDVWTRTFGDRLTFYFIDHPEFFQRIFCIRNAARIIATMPIASFFSPSAWSTWPVICRGSQSWCTSRLAGRAGAVVYFAPAVTGRVGSPPRTCLTIHNLAFQGIFPRPSYELTNLPADYFHLQGVEFYGHLSFLKAGINFADMLTTVSPRYARGSRPNNRVRPGCGAATTPGRAVWNPERR